METKCRCFFQHAALAAPVPCTSGKSQFGNADGPDPLTPLMRQTLHSGIGSL
jgi:hypothetical protein